MNTYHVALTRVRGRESLQMKTQAVSLTEAAKQIEETMPVDERDGKTLLGEIFYIVKVLP